MVSKENSGIFAGITGRAPDFASVRVTGRSSRRVLGGSKAAAFSPSSLHKSKTVATLTEKSLLSVVLEHRSPPALLSTTIFTGVLHSNAGR